MASADPPTPIEVRIHRACTANDIRMLVKGTLIEEFGEDLVKKGWDDINMLGEWMHDDDKRLFFEMSMKEVCSWTTHHTSEMRKIAEDANKPEVKARRIRAFNRDFFRECRLQGITLQLVNAEEARAPGVHLYDY